jgi:hypothetical protein
MRTYTHEHHHILHQFGLKLEHLLHNKGFWAGLIIFGIIALMFTLVALFATTGNVPAPSGVPPYPFGY